MPASAVAKRTASIPGMAGTAFGAKGESFAAFPMNLALTAPWIAYRRAAKSHDECARFRAQVSAIEAARLSMRVVRASAPLRGFRSQPGPHVCGSSNTLAD